MADIISVLVVLVFVLIVFRKRLASLFGISKQKEKAEALKETAASESIPLQEDVENVYVNVCAVDTNNFLSMKDLSHTVETELHNQLDWIYNNHHGSFVGLDVINVNGILVFLIRWHT